MLVVEAEDLMYGDLYQKKDPTINKTIGRITHDMWNLEIIYKRSIPLVLPVKVQGIGWTPNYGEQE